MEVIAQAGTGGRRIIRDPQRVSDVRQSMDLDSTYSASVNNAPASDDDSLQDGDFVTFTKNVKGGRA